MPKKYDQQSVQTKPEGVDGDSFANMAETFLLSVGGDWEKAPTWWSRARDEWLSDFWRKEGNDLLAGAVATMTAKIETTNWYLEGPEEIVKFYRNVLLHETDFGRGWDSFISKWVQSYLVRDGGGLAERARASLRDRGGPALNFHHLDESRCYYTGDPKWPVAYETGDKLRRIHTANLMRIVDMPSSKDKDRGYGFSSVSRAVSTALILQMLVKYKKERLSDLPPAAILLMNNMQEGQWRDIMKKYDARLQNRDVGFWRDLLVAFGYDPEFPVSAELFTFSDLPEHYNETDAMNMAVYTFALAFRVDPREFWPVSSGPLGTAKETNIQHIKAKGKGAGIIFTAIERQLNDPLSLPKSLKFKFDYRDDEEDLQAEAIKKAKIENIRRMWEASPNMITTEGTEEGTGMITREEARKLLIIQDILPKEFSEDVWGIEEVDRERLYDVRSYGPVVRAYRDGTFLRL